MFCYAVLGINSSSAIIPLGKRELFAAREERAGCFVLIVNLLSCYCKCSVSLPHGVIGWAAVCDCGIFWTLRFKSCAQHRRLPDVIPYISRTE